MSFTVEELQKAIEDYEGSEEFYGGSEFYSEVGSATEDENARWGKPIAIPGIGKAVGVEDFGGMDMGSERWVIFRIIGDDRLFRKNGYYASHYGTDWDGSLEVVEAFEKTVTDYRPV